MDARHGEMRERAAGCWGLQYAASRADLSCCVAARGWWFLSKFLDRRASALDGNTVGRSRIPSSSGVATLETRRIGKLRSVPDGSPRLRVPHSRRTRYRSGTVG